MQLNWGQLAILETEMGFLTSSHDVTFAFANVTESNWDKGELLQALNVSQSAG